MPNYANGKIYKIVGEDGAIYYGSTTQSLKDRILSHRSSKETSAYREIISQMDWTYELIEEYPCESRKELDVREGWYIRQNPCVNQCIPGKTDEEYRKEKLAYQNEYHQKNREKILEKMKKYRESHREDRKVYDKWKYSFGNPQYTNCLQRCDSSLFA